MRGRAAGWGKALGFVDVTAAGGALNSLLPNVVVAAFREREAAVHLNELPLGFWSEKEWHL